MARRSAPGSGRAPVARPQPGDLIAGLTVALVLVPQALAYAELAGMPPERGLYAATLALLVAAPLASSPYLATGPVAITSVLVLGVLSALAAPGSDEYVALGLLLAVIVGAVRLALGLLRAGAIAYLLSRPMLVGFVPAATLLIAASQLPALSGARAPGDGVLADAGWTVVHPGAWEPAALAMAALTVVIVVGARRVDPRLPGALTAVALAIGASALLAYPGPTVGRIDAGLPPLSADLPWSDVGLLLVPGVIIALVGFAEPAAIARSLAARDRLAWDPSRELVSQGAANLTAGLSGGFPIGGSFSRSSLNREAGARTAWSGAVTGATVLLLLPLAGLLAPLPTAVLAAIVVLAVLPLMRPPGLAALWRNSKPAFMIAAGTFAATLLSTPRIERGVLLGIGLSVAVHLWRELRVDVEAWQEGTTLHMRPQGVMWFGAVQGFQDALVDELSRHERVEAVRVHLDGIGRLDFTAAATLHDLLDDLERSGLDVSLEGVTERDERLVRGVVGHVRRPMRD